MSWFGWVTKTHCNVTGMDQLIAAGELILVMAIFLGGYGIWYQIQLRRLKRRKSGGGK